MTDDSLFIIIIFISVPVFVFEYTINCNIDRTLSFSNIVNPQDPSEFEIEDLGHSLI